MTAVTTERLAARIKTFSDRYPWIGPALWMLSALYFLAQIVVGWVWNPPYSVIKNTISDLGNTRCAQYGGSYVCSPRHDLMNAAFILLGVVMAAGSLLIYQEFTETGARERMAARIGFSGLAIGGVGAMMVGIFPENVHHMLHVVGAGLAIGGGNLGILILGFVLPLPEGLRGYMVFFSIISMTALVLFAAQRYFGIGAGTMERIAAYPETLWLIRFGLYMSRNRDSKSARAPG
jgi:hypothetical membrane protein